MDVLEALESHGSQATASGSTPSPESGTVPGRPLRGSNACDGQAWRANLSNITYSARSNHPQPPSRSLNPIPRSYISDRPHVENTSFNVKSSKPRPGRHPPNAHPLCIPPSYPEVPPIPPPLPNGPLLVALLPTHGKIRSATLPTFSSQPPPSPSKRQKHLDMRILDEEIGEEEETPMIPLDDLTPISMPASIITNFVVQKCLGPPISLSQPQPAPSHVIPEVAPPLSFLYETFAKKVEGLGANK